MTIKAFLTLFPSYFCAFIYEHAHMQCSQQGLLLETWSPKGDFFLKTGKKGLLLGEEGSFLRKWSPKFHFSHPC